MIRVPVLTPRLSSYWVALVTPVETGLVRPLVDGPQGGDGGHGRAAGGDQRRAAGLRRRRPGGAATLSHARGLPSTARGERRVADAVIRDPEEHTVMDARGAVRSVQAADLSMPAQELDAIWSPMHLERLARTYWKYLSRVTLGLIRVAYTPTERLVVLITQPFVLLRFDAPGVRDGRRARRRALAHPRRPARRPEGRAATATWRSTCAAAREVAPGARACTSRWRSRPSTP